MDNDIKDYWNDKVEINEILYRLSMFSSVNKTDNNASYNSKWLRFLNTKILYLIDR